MRTLSCTLCCSLLWSCGSANSDDLFGDPAFNARGKVEGPFSGDGAVSSHADATLNSGGAGSGAGGSTSDSGSLSSGGDGSGGGQPSSGGAFAAGGAQSSGGAPEMPHDSGMSNMGSGGAEGERPDASTDSPDATCPSGDYAGTLTGSYRVSSVTTMIAVEIAFAIDDEGAVTGTFEGIGLNMAEADLVGVIDCATGALTMTIENGSYPSTNGRVTFRGTLKATYDSTEHFPDGTWTIYEPRSDNGGQGTWSAE